jgi:hypothetical protein
VVADGSQREVLQSRTMAAVVSAETLQQRLRKHAAALPVGGEAQVGYGAHAVSFVQPDASVGKDIAVDCWLMLQVSGGGRHAWRCKPELEFDAAASHRYAA